MKKKTKKFCVYFYFNEEKEVIYIGQSVDVKNRWYGHYSDKWRNEVCLIGVKEYPDKVSMEIMERYYITKLWPKYNTQFKELGRTKLTLKDNIKMLKFSIEEFEAYYA